MRRVRVQRVAIGKLELAEAEAHHVRDVLRLEAGAEVEVFDAEGNLAVGRLEGVGKKVVVMVDRVEERMPGFEWWVAAAIPKGTRGDWMVEKLSELGTSGFVPLITARSVASAEGKNKLARWERLAGEAAKQSKRRGVMRIGKPTDVEEFVRELRPPGWYLSLDERAKNIADVVATVENDNRLTVLIGPEGGWTAEEIAMFDQAGLTGVRMGGSILRVETAAVAAAAIVAAMIAPTLD